MFIFGQMKVMWELQSGLKPKFYSRHTRLELRKKSFWTSELLTILPVNSSVLEVTCDLHIQLKYKRAQFEAQLFTLQESINIMGRHAYVSSCS